jgi:hypothetical protein
MFSLKSQHIRLMAPFLVMVTMSCFSLQYLMTGAKRHLLFVLHGLDATSDSEDPFNATLVLMSKDLDGISKIDFDDSHLNDTLFLRHGNRDSMQKSALSDIQSNEILSAREIVNAGQKGARVKYRSDSREAEVLENAVVTESRVNHTIVTWREVEGMQIIIKRYWSGNLFCDFKKIRSEVSNPNHPITVNVMFGCKELYERSGLGTGNYIGLLYGIRLAAHVYGNIDVNFTCYDAYETKQDLILPWLMGWFPSRPTNQPSMFPVTCAMLCNNYSSPYISHMYKEMQYDFRKMAIGLLGVPHPDHPSALFAEQHLWTRTHQETQDSLSAVSFPQITLPNRDDLPPFPASESDLDDAVLHFRCGDLMDSTNSFYAFMKFSGLTRHISPAAKSIGILTQPFEDSVAQERKADADSKKRDRCRVVVHSLVEFIEERYPYSDVRLRNSVNDTIALTYARMIMANQTIAGISSFGVIPAIATFGTGYLREPDYPRAPVSWVLRPRIDELADNIVLFKEPRFMKAVEMKDLWETQGETGVLKWFWDDTFVYVKQNISEVEK